MLKSKISSALTSILSIILLLHSPLSAHAFLDVSADAWFKVYVDELSAQGIVSAQNSNFYPNRPITRAELAKVAVTSGQQVGLLASPMLSQEQAFCDVAVNNWAHIYVTVLKGKGVTGANASCAAGKNFMPNQFVTRAEALKILFLVYNMQAQGRSTFPDVESSAWYSGYINAATSMGIVRGYADGTFKPNGFLTRAEMAKIISVMMGLIGERPAPTPTPSPSPTSTATPSPTARSTRQINITPAQGEQALRDAINNAEPGDEILLAAGTYRLSRQLWIDKQGTASQPIIIRSKDGDFAAKITGSPEEGINIGDGAAYLTLDGLEVYGMGDNVIHIQNAHHITVQNVRAHDAGSDGDVVKVNQAHHISILRSEFSRPGARPGCPGENCWQEALDFVDTDDSIIHDNILSDFGNLAGYVKGGSTNVIIEKNIIQNQRAGAGDPAWGIGGWTDSELLRGKQYEANNITFRNNILRNNTYGALGIYDATNVTISNNQFINNHGTLIEFRAGNAPAEKSSNITIEGNTFNGNQTDDTSICHISSHELTGLTLRNNRGDNTAIVAATSCTED
ncbi:MAG: S-layer homology domain-containing protein [Candidatus Abawacabacteria bacterium]|nr:S-layer homology domain-containing protein [Candidatus Abawacabacteria bacterium]